MILSTILLLSPTLSPLALQQAEPQVIIRRQGVESAPQKVRVRVQEPAPVQGRVVQVHPEHSHEEHQHKLKELQELKEVQLLETEMLALELATLEAELAQLEQAMVITDFATQEPGHGESHARIVIRYGDGREEVMEWSGHEGDLHQELSHMLGQGSGHHEMIFLSEEGPECGDCEESSSCEEAASCESEASCELEVAYELLESCEDEFEYAMLDSCEATACEDEEEIILSYASPSTGAWMAEAPQAMAFGTMDLNFGCDCEGCPLSSQSMQNIHAAPQMGQHQVIRLGSGQAPMAQAGGQIRMGHVQAGVAAPQPQGRMLHAQQALADHGLSFHVAPPQRVEQHQMRVPMPPTPPMPPQGMRQGGGVMQRVDHLEQRLDRIEAMLAELLERR
jgi:hypothetical protein